MPNTSDPDRYSIDDMMERLKNRPSENPVENGELVTRADGTKAIKVRKRKRRSKQPHKEERRRVRKVRMFQVSAALILILLAVFALGAAVVYSNSTPYRKKLEREIAQSTGANVDLRRFRMNPATANADSLQLDWPEGNALKSLFLRNLTARISPSSLAGKSLNGEEITALSGKLNLSSPATGHPLRTTSNETSAIPISFQRYAVSSLDILFGNPDSPVARLTGSEASFSPSNSNRRSQLLLNGGNFSMRGWPGYRITRSHIEFRGPLVDVVSIRLADQSGSRGIFELGGTISPLDASQTSTLAMALEYYPFEEIAGEHLAAFFDCRIETLSSAKSNFITFSPDGSTPPTMAMSFTNAPTSILQMQGLPFLLVLSSTMQDSWFEHPSFEEEVSGTLRRTNGETAITNLNLVNRARMAIRGSIKISNGNKLGGTLRVGITKAMLLASGSPSLQNAFSPEHDGFRWIDISLGGTVQRPADNLKELLDAALSGAGPAAGSPAAVPSFEELTLPE